MPEEEIGLRHEDWRVKDLELQGALVKVIE